MIQVYRVITEFEGQKLPWEPLRIERLAPGDLVVALGSEDSYTTFCRHDDFTEISKRDQFVIHDWEFERWTEIYEAG